jgi:hypothetical protein
MSLGSLKYCVWFYILPNKSDMLAHISAKQKWKEHHVKCEIRNSNSGKGYTTVFCVVKFVHSTVLYGFMHCGRIYCPHFQVRSNIHKYNSYRGAYVRLCMDYKNAYILKTDTDNSSESL